MSLTVRVSEFRLPKPKANLIGRVVFRGKFKSSSSFSQVYFQQECVWRVCKRLFLLLVGNGCFENYSSIQ